MKWLLFLALFLCASPVYAAYDTARSGGPELQLDGHYKFTYTFTGNAGEEPVKRDYISSTVFADVGDFIARTLAELNALRVVARDPRLAKDQIVAPAARATAPTLSTAAADCLLETRRLAKYLALGTVPAGALLTKIQAQPAIVRNCYEGLIAQDKTDYDKAF